MSRLHMSAVTALIATMLAGAAAHAQDQPIGAPIQLLAPSMSQPSDDGRPSLFERAARVFRPRYAENAPRPIEPVPFAAATGMAMPLDFDDFVAGPDESAAAAAVPAVESPKPKPTVRAVAALPRLPRTRPASIAVEKVAVVEGAAAQVAAARAEVEPALAPAAMGPSASVQDEAGQLEITDIPSGDPAEEAEAAAAAEGTPNMANSPIETEEARAEPSDIEPAKVETSLAPEGDDATLAEEPRAEAAASDEADSEAAPVVIAEEAEEPVTPSEPDAEPDAGTQPVQDEADHQGEGPHGEALAIESEPEAAADAAPGAGPHPETDHGDDAVAADPAEETIGKADEPAELDVPDEAATEAATVEAHAAEPAEGDPSEASPAFAHEEIAPDDGAARVETVHAAPSHADDEAAHPEADRTDEGEVASASAEISYPDGTPRDLVLSLQVLQDRIAAGSTEAFAAQRDVLDRIERAFATMPPEAWSDPGNAAALVTYTLSGGKPTTLREVLTRGPMPPLDEKLLHGALAYVEGRAEAAKNALAGVDARSFPPSMGSQVAIAQAALQIGDDPEAASRLLDLARLLSPGTLAEEAAIRRALPVAAQLQDAEKFQLLARQYVERFRRSVYAGNFRQRFAASLTRMDFIDTPEGFAKLDDILGVLEPEARREILLLVSRAALVKAKTGAAMLAADAIIMDPAADAQAQERAKTYRAAAALVLPDRFDEVSNALAGIDATLLEAADRELLDLAAETAALVRSAADRPAGAVPAAAEGEADPKSDVAARAETAIASVDTLLESTR